VPQMMLALVYPVVLGLDRLETASFLRSNGNFQYLTGLPSFPDPQTLRRFLLQAPPRFSDQLHRVNDRLLQTFTHLPDNRSRLIFDLDSTVVTVFGHQAGAEVGYNPRYRGKRSYNPLLCMEANSGYLWDAQLRDGHRLSAIGGSDSHNATAPPGPIGSIGWPTTVIEADELSVAAILSGIRTGRTFVDLTASHDKQLDFEAESGGARARMGETLHNAAGAPLKVQVHAVACAGSIVHLLLDGEEKGIAPPMPVDNANFDGTVAVTVSAGRHWLRLEVRDSDGTLQLMSSPLYINFPEQ